MHSIRETCGSRDVEFKIKLVSRTSVTVRSDHQS